MKFSKLHSDLKIIEFKFLHLKTIVYYCMKNCPIFTSSTSLESPQAPLHGGMHVFTVVQIVEKLWANVQDMLSTPVRPPVVGNSNYSNRKTQYHIGRPSPSHTKESCRRNGTPNFFFCWFRIHLTFEASIVVTGGELFVVRATNERTNERATRGNASHELPVGTVHRFSLVGCRPWRITRWFRWRVRPYQSVKER